MPKLTLRLFSLVLLGLLGLVHAELWLGRSGVPRVRELNALVERQKVENAAATERNAHDLAELKDLREGLEIVEEKARSDLGMVKADEILVQYAK
jgi:cell division protein FtsB